MTTIWSVEVQSNLLVGLELGCVRVVPGSIFPYQTPIIRNGPNLIRATGSLPDPTRRLNRYSGPKMGRSFKFWLNVSFFVPRGGTQKLLVHELYELVPHMIDGAFPLESLHTSILMTSHCRDNFYRLPEEFIFSLTNLRRGGGCKSNSSMGLLVPSEMGERKPYNIIEVSNKCCPCRVF